MSLARRIAEIMDTLVPADLDALRPADRRRFAEQCRYWAAQADQADKSLQQPRPKTGVLADVRNGKYSTD